MNSSQGVLGSDTI